MGIQQAPQKLPDIVSIKLPVDVNSDKQPENLTNVEDESKRNPDFRK